MEFVDLKKQYLLLEDDINSNIKNVLEHGKYINGPEIETLENELSSYIGSTGCVSTSSGTDALILALMALEIKPGDEVITTPFSFISTAETIIMAGAIPVFVDINPTSYNLDPALIEKAITEKTKAIIAVSLYGQMADFESINKIAKRNRLAVIEDGAQSFGATFREKKSCSISTIGCTSFFPSKPLGCYGDGGACFSDDLEILDKMRKIRNHGQEARYHHTLIGFNGRLDTIQAAVLLAKFEQFKSEVKKRNLVGQKYSQKIQEICPTKVKVPEILEHYTSVFAQYTIQVEHRKKIVDLLKMKGIPTSVHYPTPLHQQPAIERVLTKKESFPKAEQAAKKVLSLPMHPYLSDGDIQTVADALKFAFDNIEI